MKRLLLAILKSIAYFILTLMLVIAGEFAEPIERLGFKCSGSISDFVCGTGLNIIE